MLPKESFDFLPLNGEALNNIKRSQTFEESDPTLTLRPIICIANLV